MPYQSLKDANPAIRGIEPKVTLAQANLIAEWADAMENSEDPPESPWAAAIAQFKRLYVAKGDHWVQRAATGELGEAATLKTAAQRLMRDCEAILADKALPASLRKEIEDVRAALRRRWADLEAEAGETTEFDPDQPRDEAGRFSGGGGGDGGGGNGGTSGGEGGGGRSPSEIKGRIKGIKKEIGALDREIDFLVKAIGSDEADRLGRAVKAKDTLVDEWRELHGQLSATSSSQEVDVMPKDTSGVTVAETATFDVDGRAVPLSELLNTYRLWEAEEGEREKARKAQAARSKQYGISVTDEGNVTKPSEFANVSDSDFGDPVNYAYPADAGHARAALGYFNREGQREDGGYSERDWAVIGQRLAKLVGRALEAPYEYTGGKLARRKESSELDAGLEDFAGRVRSAFYAAFRSETPSGCIGPYVQEVYLEHPIYGTSVIAEDNGDYWHVPFTKGDGGYGFSDRAGWKRVVRIYQFVGTPAAQETIPAQAAELAEDGNLAGLVNGAEAEAFLTEIVTEGRIAEVDTAALSNGARSPVVVDLRIIKPGPGNARDRRYYPLSTLQKCAHVFEGADMFLTDHKENEVSEPTKVGRVRKVIRVDEDGAVARAVIYDPALAEKTRNRAQANELETMHVSIKGDGLMRPGTVNGQQYSIVEGILPNPRVDFVSKAGAGGQVLALAESSTGVQSDAPTGGETMAEQQQEQTTQPEPQAAGAPAQEAQAQPAPTFLTADAVKAILVETALPEPSRARLVGEKEKPISYADEAALREAIAAETEYVKALTGSGKPTGGAGQPVQAQTVSLEEVERRKAAVNARWLGTRPPAALQNEGVKKDAATGGKQ